MGAGGAKASEHVDKGPSDGPAEEAALLEGKESQGRRAGQDLTTFSFLPVARSHLSPHKNSSFVEAKDGSNSADPQSCDQRPL